MRSRETVQQGGFEGSGFQECSSQGHSINMLTRIEDWEVWNNFGSDPHRRVLVGETSYETAGMQIVQRIKRQNCGNNEPGHHNLIFGSRDQIGSRIAVANGEAEGIMSHSPGLYGLADQGNRKVHESNFQSAPVQVGSRSSSGFASYVESCLRRPTFERDGLHYQESGSVARTGGRSSYKRKSSIDDAIGSMGSLTFRPFIELRERDFSWFTEVVGTSRADSAFPSTSSDLVSTSRIPILGELSYSRDSNMMYQPIRPRSSPHLQIGSNRYCGGPLHGPQELCHAPYVQNNSVSLYSFPSQLWMSRGILSHEHTMQSVQPTPSQILHEFSPFNQGNVSSAVVPWCGRSVSGESINHPNLNRDSSGGPAMGSYARNFMDGASIWMAVPPWMPNTHKPSNSVSSGLPFRESSSQGFHMAHVRHMHSSLVPYVTLPALLTGHTNFYPQSLLCYPSASRAATVDMIFGSQAAPGNAHPSFELLNRSAMPPPLLGSAASGGGSPLHNFYGMPLQRLEILRAERASGPPRLPSREILDHASVYNGFDVYDPHLGLQPDVDNMSYEELLALEERIGNVNTGLSGEDICKCLKTSKHSLYDVTKLAVSQDSEVKCSICQEEYMEGDEIGQLNCSHGYHTACIKQWLLLKNQCPICKAAALSLP